MNEILLVGGGGHCLSVIDAIEREGTYKIKGVIDHNNKVGQIIGDYQVIGSDDDLPMFFNQGVRHAFITLGSVGNASPRYQLYEMCEMIGFNLPVIIDPSAIIANDVTFNGGCFIGKGAIINREVSLGEGSIINSRAVIEHNSFIGDFTHVAPGALIAGNVSVGAFSHIGIGATVIQQINIGEHVLIGAASNVLNNIPSFCRAYGNPCRVVAKQ